MNYFKIREGRGTTCFATDLYKSIPDVIAALNKAVDQESDGKPISQILRESSGEVTDISERDWDDGGLRHKAEQDEDRYMNIDVISGFASFSNWKGGMRTVVSGAIFRLTGCYETALHDGKLDGDHFVTNLLQHCSIDHALPEPMPTMDAMGPVTM